MKRPPLSREVRASRPPARQEMLVTVRLFPPIHGPLIEELSQASRGLRASRAICLMALGLAQERAHGAVWQSVGTAIQPARQPHPAAVLAVEDGAFVAALLQDDQRMLEARSD